MMYLLISAQSMNPYAYSTLPNRIDINSICRRKGKLADSNFTNWQHKSFGCCKGFWDNMAEILFNRLISLLLTSCNFQDCFGFLFELFFTTITTPFLSMPQRTQEQHGREAVHSGIFSLVTSCMFDLYKSFGAEAIQEKLISTNDEQ